ncbi:MAG: pyrroloquinoline quinone biosynthesis protein PqqE [Terriglobales bacterium]|jgi:pyrroloquinoline quinone biosynthesis protein E
MLAAPLALIAEVTHRCPLHCVYCSNPLEMAAAQSELGTKDWCNVFQQAARMGVLHLHLSGGEPLVREDILELVDAAHKAGLYTNLITSGVGLTEPRLSALLKAGLDHVQLSFQDSLESNANWIAGTRAHALKVKIAPVIRESGVAFTINMVVHRQNLDHLKEMIALAESLQPQRMEIAHAQYYGWAFKNREALLPTQKQVEESLRIVADAQKRMAGRIRIDAVVPDYYARYPKACMGGWGQRQVLVDPTGKALPCHAAWVIPGLQFENVREHPLEWIWRESESFQKFRGEQWMPEPCRSCDRRSQDFGGCRCQAMLITGDATATDPACSLAPGHFYIEEQLNRVNAPANSASISAQQPGTAPEGFWTYRPQPQ